MELIKVFRFLLSILQLLGIVCVCSSNCSTKNYKRIKRITDNDLDAAKNSVPYLIRLDYSDELGKHFLCSGTLLHPSFVITAAHCITGLPIQNITARGDLSFIKTYVEPRRITHISTPREFGENFKDYDIAILKIEPPFYTESEFMRPIELCNSHMENGDHLQVSGYARHLMNATYMTWQRCQKLYNGKMNITRNMFCGASEIDSAACSPDAGGPVVHNGKLCGIVLWSAGWLDCKYPEVYMSTKCVRRFIEYTLASM